MYEELSLIYEAMLSATSLGLSTSMRDLPISKPHGFWMDRHGNFVRVGFQNHDAVAVQVLKKMGENVNGRVYNLLFKKGWVRIVLGSNILFWENPYEQINPIQKRNMDFMAEFYELTRGVMEDR